MPSRMSVTKSCTDSHSPAAELRADPARPLGEYAWAVWESQIRKVLPSGAYPLVELPKEHTMFHQVYQVPKVPQIPSINFWRGSGGDTYERPGPRGIATARAILDEHQRVAGVPQDGVVQTGRGIPGDFGRHAVEEP